MTYQRSRIIPPKNGAADPELIDTELVELDPSILANVPREYVKATDDAGMPTHISQWDCLNGWHVVYVRTN